MEATVSLFIFTLCFSLFSMAVKQIEVVQRIQESDRQLEWHLFLNQFEYDVQDVKLKHVTSDTVTFIKNPASGEEVAYTRYKQKLLRKVGDKGHQPMLMKLSKLSFNLKGSFLAIQADFLNGEKFQAHISLANQMKETTHE